MAAGALARDLLGEQFFQRLAIFEIHRHVDIPRHVRLPNVELLEQGREEFAGIKRFMERRRPQPVMGPAELPSSLG